MVHNTKNNCICGLCPSSEISVVQWLRLALSEGPNRVGASLLSPEDGSRCSSETLCFLVI
jgi:hypothetical protein